MSPNERLMDGVIWMIAARLNITDSTQRNGVNALRTARVHNFFHTCISVF